MPSPYQPAGRAFEILESRHLLTAGVTVSLVGDNLVINGDKSDNSIQITQDGRGEFVIAGGQVTTGHGALHQDSAGQVTVTGTVKNVAINMNGQNDTVAIVGTLDNGNTTLVAPLAISGHLSINLGKGNAQIGLLGVTVGGATTIRDNGKDAHNLLIVTGSTFGGALTINFGGVYNLAVLGEIGLTGLTNTFDGAVTYHGSKGQDLFASFGGAEFKGNVLVDLQAGDDIALLGDATFDGSVLLLGGAGQDILGTYPSESPMVSDPRRTVIHGFESNVLPPI